jgi:uncharacterized membrane-anchored protein
MPDLQLLAEVAALVDGPAFGLVRGQAGRRAVVIVTDTYEHKDRLDSYRRVAVVARGIEIAAEGSSKAGAAGQLPAAEIVCPSRERTNSGSSIRHPQAAMRLGLLSFRMTASPS